MEPLLFQDQVLNIKPIKLEIPKILQLIKLLLLQEFIKVLDIKVELVQDQDQESTKAEQECIKVELDQAFIKADLETIKPVPPLEPINQHQEPIKLEPQEHQEVQLLAIKLEAINHIKLDLVQALTNLELIEHPLVQLELPAQVELPVQLVQQEQLAAASLLLLPIDMRRNEHIDL